MPFNKYIPSWAQSPKPATTVKKGKARASENPAEPNKTPTPVPPREITESERLERERAVAMIKEGRERADAQLKMCEKYKRSRRFGRAVGGWVEKATR
jgi:hypothetical protein